MGVLLLEQTSQGGASSRKDFLLPLPSAPLSSISSCSLDFREKEAVVSCLLGELLGFVLGLCRQGSVGSLAKIVQLGLNVPWLLLP